MENDNVYINHSGGCIGSDIEWETQCYDYSIKTISYSFPNHIQYGKNPKILNSDELNEGWEQVLLCEKPIRRPLYKINNIPYVKNLLCRNWFQVKNADAIFAIGRFVIGSNKLFDGGTGWAVQMAINNKKKVYVFDQNIDSWFIFYYPKNEFAEISGSPYLTKNFAGIGTREINENGKQAIKNTLKLNLNGK